ncbi:hypothetical protein B0H13DRAFT_320061 [Mycena leptocephala]|nr:hypothetical protein B0H13DRAFT_320061 [Mycena leptocephala]
MKRSQLKATSPHSEGSEGGSAEEDEAPPPSPPPKPKGKAPARRSRSKARQRSGRRAKKVPLKKMRRRHLSRRRSRRVRCLLEDRGLRLRQRSRRRAKKVPLRKMRRRHLARRRSPSVRRLLEDRGLRLHRRSGRWMLMRSSLRHQRLVEPKDHGRSPLSGRAIQGLATKIKYRHLLLHPGVGPLSRLERRPLLRLPRRKSITLQTLILKTQPHPPFQ